MSELLHVVCPHCDGVNRVPAGKLGAGGKCGSCHRLLFSGHPLELDGSRFQRHTERSDLPLLVDFWAPWCGPCKIMAPVLVQAAAQLEPGLRVVKVNTDQEQGLAMQFGIRSIPTLALFRRGREQARIAGAMDLAQLLAWVRQNVG